jgi:uncharacterized protein
VSNIYGQYGSFIDSSRQKAKEYNKTDKKGLKQGLWVYFFRPYPQEYAINVSYGFYHNDKYIGVWQTRNRNAQLLDESIYFDTLYQKVQITDYYLNGKPKSFGFHYTKQLNKPDTFFYAGESRKDKIKLITQKAMKGGKWFYYYENGKIESEGLYFEDIKDGIWKYYNLEGVLIKEEEYEEGILKK